MDSTSPAITVSAHILATPKLTWNFWTQPKHIVQWNNASDDWHTPKAEIDLRPGGRFVYRMEAKDGSMGFDFGGTFTHVDHLKKIAFVLDDDRKVEVQFNTSYKGTDITEIFEPEQTNSIELQQFGWQSILDNFKKYAEQTGQFHTLHFEIIIHAPVEKVYATMLADKSYREWTSIFNSGSYYKGSWEKGSDIHFIGTDKDGKEGGMLSRIKENIPNSFVSIEHLGMIVNGEAITTGEEIELWAGALENYAFSDENGTTTLKVSLDTGGGYEDYFKDTWPRALDKLKEICEA